MAGVGRGGAQLLPKVTGLDGTGREVDGQGAEVRGAEEVRPEVNVALGDDDWA